MTAEAANRADEVPTLRTISPNLSKKVLGKLSAFIEVKRQGSRDSLAASLRRLHDLWEGEAWSLELRAVALVLADLIDQGWEVTTEQEKIHLLPPGLRLVGETIQQAKERLRKALQIGRDRQLADAGVQNFLGRMHRVVPREVGRSSIADIVESGSELAALLRPLAALPVDQALARLPSVIDPVIEVCDEDAKCSVTGLRLLDIWRYFRHTWSLEYRSMPGRQLAFLVRNAARPNRPVMGIAMLASPVVRMRVRDDWIGWYPEPFIAALRSGRWDVEAALRAVVSRLERNISQIRSDDLVTADELALPSERTILRLEQRSAGAAVSRQRKLEEFFSQAEEANEAVRSQRFDPKDLSVVDWRAASEEFLFVRKRAGQLALMLDAKRTFQAVDWRKTGLALLDDLLRHPNGLRTLGVALQEVRKAGLSSQIADVSVCGAVAPYSVLLGGKLVALLMTSHEVREAYRTRYEKQVSIISSQMAGRPIYRPSDLKLLTTTSLYGMGSSQYNRLRLRSADHPQLAYDIHWRELAQTAGYGSVHLSSTTVRVLREMSEKMFRARRVNNRFGEGSSPRLRQVREAIQALGIDSSNVLHHATPRISYACELHPLAIDELIGVRSPTNGGGPTAAVLAALWRTRWLANRIRNVSVLDTVSISNARTLQDFFTATAVFTPKTEPVEESVEEPPAVYDLDS